MNGHQVVSLASGLWELSLQKLVKRTDAARADTLGVCLEIDSGGIHTPLWTVAQAVRVHVSKVRPLSCSKSELTQKNLRYPWRGVPSPACMNVLGRKSSTVEKDSHENLLLDSDRKFAHYWNGV